MQTNVSMKTRHLFILLLALFATLSAKAQNSNIAVASFRLLPNDMAANLQGTSRIDQNGHTCALIKVVTTQTGFTFDVGIMGVTDTEQKAGEIWVWVPFGVKHINIGHPTLGFLRDYYFPCSVEEARTYEMVLTTGEVVIHVKEKVTQQFLVIKVTPPDAMVTVGGTPLPVEDGVASKKMDFGKYDYRVEAPDYHPEVGKVEINDPDNKKILTVNLNPAFGWLKIEGDNSILSKASIYIDNSNGADALHEKRQLKSGQHKVQIVHPLYKPYEQTITIADNQVYTLNANLNANFSNVTLKVDDNAEIWINDEKKGNGSWTGNLEAATYAFESRKENHRTAITKKTITENMNGQTIILNVPTPINGSLVVSSSPALAKILIDGKEVGETPLQINTIIIGQHSLRIEKAGCAPVSKTITIEEGKTLTLEEKLDTGRNLTVETDRKGDKVYVDREYVGETPIHTSVGFGTHTVKAVRGKDEQSKDIEVKIGGSDIELFFEFGRLISITTDRDGDAITIDGESVGTSPLRIDLAFGQHSIHAQREKKYEDKDIVVSRTGGPTEHHLVLHGETAKSFVKRGVNFILLNGAVSSFQQRPTFGLTVGQVKQLGWYASYLTNFNFTKTDKSCDAEGHINGDISTIYIYDKTSIARWSATAGALCKLGCPVYLYAGAGYSQYNVLWRTQEGQWVHSVDYSSKGLIFEAGLMAHIKGFSISAGMSGIGTQYWEIKIGLGYCFKKR